MPKKARPPHPDAAKVMASARQHFGSNLATQLLPGTVDAAADWTGVDRSTLYRWRDQEDDREPGLFRALALAAFLKVPLAELIGEQPITRPLTPYEREPRYAQLIDTLESASIEDRDRLLEFITWAAARAGQQASSTSASLEQFSVDARRLAAAVDRLDEESKRVFFHELADNDAFNVLRLRRRVPDEDQ